MDVMESLEIWWELNTPHGLSLRTQHMQARTCTAKRRAWLNVYVLIKYILLIIIKIKYTMKHMELGILYHYISNHCKCDHRRFEINGNSNTLTVNYGVK